MKIGKMLVGSILASIGVIGFWMSGRIFIEMIGLPLSNLGCLYAAFIFLGALSYWTHIILDGCIEFAEGS